MRIATAHALVIILFSFFLFLGQIIAGCFDRSKSHVQSRACWIDLLESNN